MNTTFPKNLAKLRREKKVSQRLVADALGVSQALLSHYENGIREPGIVFILKAAEYYSCSVDFLLGRTMDRKGASLLVGQDDGHPEDEISPDGKRIEIEKKLLFNAINLLVEILKSANNEELLSLSFEHVKLCLYKQFRFICNCGGSETDYFTLPDDVATPLTEALLKLNAYKMQTLAPAKSGVPMVLEYDALSEKYPVMWQSLLSVLQSVDKLMSDLASEKT